MIFIRSALLCCLAVATALRAEVVISEIMFHPASENDAEEYIELLNTGAAAEDLSGWSFSRGVSFTFPPGVALPAGARLVVTADPAAFQARYPGVTNLVASLGWTGRLSNSSETIELRDALEIPRARVAYADDGDWAVRRRQDPSDHGHRGWVWRSAADGQGASLELINPAFDAGVYANWAPSMPVGGTPGAPNSVAAANAAPGILDVAHTPASPTSAQAVAVTARIVDELAVGQVTLRFRLDGATPWDDTPMFDDGAHGDGLPGDGIFGALLPARPDGSIVEYHLTATDLQGLSRDWPAAAREVDDTPVRACNALYQVSDEAPSGALPFYRLVMRAADRAELAQINANTPAAPLPFNPGEPNDQTRSHSRFNATWISQDGTGWQVRHRCGVRNRGNGSRNTQPPSFALAFPVQETWRELADLNLNSQHTPYQVLGSALFRASGLAIGLSHAARLRINGVNPTGSGSPSYGFYACNEPLNSAFTSRHFPLDPSGNAYRGIRLDTGSTAAGTDVDGADLALIVPAPGETLSLPEIYDLNYDKRTNESQDDWSDLIALTAALAKGHSGATPTDPVTYDADFVAAVTSRVVVAQWMAYMAACDLADNTETNIANGDGDDFNLYFGVADPRAHLLPYDLDSILGRSSGSSSITHPLFRMCENRVNPGTPAPLNAFMKHPDFVAQYYGELIRLMDGPFEPAALARLADEVLGGVAPPAVVQAMKTFNTNRHAFVSTQVPRAISVSDYQTTAGVALTPLNGYPRSLAPACRLSGRAHAARTRSVTVHGVAAVWSAWEARWTAASVALTPGVNRVRIRAFDADGIEFENASVDVWYDDLNQVTTSGTLAASATWTAAGGPYRVNGSLTIPDGVTLTIQPGATLWLGSTGSVVNITVAAGGRLLAEGTEAQPIRFMALPGATYTWGGIVINGRSPFPAETRIVHAVFEGNNGDAIHTQNNANVVLGFLEFRATNRQYLSLDNSTFLVHDCVFPDATAAFEPVHGAGGGIAAGGRGVFRDCFFGRAIGYNDVIDFTGGNRPGPILQIYGCVFTGSDDDLLDLDGTDAWIEDNLFMHVHRVGTPDSASAISGGNDSTRVSDITAVRNLFVDVDQAATAKQGNFYILAHNTVIDQNGRISEDEETGVINLADEGTTSAVGMLCVDNVVHSAEHLARNYNPANSVVTFRGNLLPMAWTGPGSSNRVAAARLNAPGAIPTPTAANWRYLLPLIRAAAAPDACSPARGAASDGLDMGAAVPAGVALLGAPTGTNGLASATIQVKGFHTGDGIPAGANNFPQGGGYVTYRWRLDGGAWSASTPASTPISLAGLANGPHTLEVVGRNDAGYDQDHPERGGSARVTTATWVTQSGYTPPSAPPRVVFSEILASNTATLNYGSVYPDLLELTNLGDTPADISGWGLTDNNSLPFKYVIPPGTILAPGGFWVVHASGSSSVPAPKTGFGLKAGGDTVTLTRSAADGGGIADQVPFGRQIADRSAMRCADGTWTLGVPTFGAANLAADLGPVSVARLNEWLADAAWAASGDFLELHNPSTLPVDIGRCFLTDEPIGWPRRHALRQLTFLPAGGYAVFRPDGDPGQGPDHLDFKLAASGGELGLSDPDGVLIDRVRYAPQTIDVSQGRTPNGGIRIASFAVPTPGGPNPGTDAGGAYTLSTVNLLPVNHSWKHASSAVDYSATFYAPSFNDAAWNSGGQLLYIESAALNNAVGFVKTTLLPNDAGNSNRPFNATYFRSQFVFSGSAIDSLLQAQVMIDDGAVFYLNGQEIVPATGRLRMPAGTPDFNTIATGSAVGDATVETLQFPASALIPGANVIAVAVHQQHSGATQSSSDVVFGMKLDLITTNYLDTALSVHLNEVLVRNASLPNPDGSLTGWVELINGGSSPADLAGMALSDDPAAPLRFVFPPSALVPPGGRRVVTLNPLAAASATNAPFALAPDGGALHLYLPPALGGGIQDALRYGRQIPDYSLARAPDTSGAFVLAAPTRGAANASAATGSPSALRINEWLAAPSAGNDFLELYNPAVLPVAVGGLHLSDRPLDRFRAPLPPLSFIAAGGWQAWTADGDNDGTPGHLPFGLETNSGFLGLFDDRGVALHTLHYGGQSLGIAEGSYPDGSPAVARLLPTPGAANVPYLNDADQDGMDDTWELSHSLNPGSAADAAQDADGDGVSNLDEYRAGSHPRDAASVFRASLQAVAGQTLLSFTANPGRSYTVQYKDRMADPAWIPLLHIPAPSFDTPWLVSDPTAGPLVSRHYRLKTPAGP